MVPNGTITVAVRVRPPTSWEAARLPETVYDTTIHGDGSLYTPNRPVTAHTGLRDIVQIIDDRVLCFDPAETDRTKAFVERGFLPPGSKRYKDKRFIFDRVFDRNATQQDVYEATSKPLLTNVLDGFNTTVFAYGATGCGKTHTISGTSEQPGVIYLTMADLFQLIEDRKDEYSFGVLVTFLEIYNEEIRDLLAEPGQPTPRGGLQIREDKSVKVSGLTELHPASADEVKQIVLLGNTRRTQSPTNANETSSRSHAVLQVHVTRSPRTANVTEERTVATLSIIDLAGSERAAATTNMGQRMVEGANINKSLLALGNCINSLCESGGAVRHVPYRNSKLTRLLKFSLGGNCKTVMIVCVAPTSQHFDDTHNTLIYAERATRIKTKVVTRNVLNVNRHVGQYVEAINRLNQEVAELKAKLAGQLRKDQEIANRKRAESLAEVEKAKKDLQAKADQTQSVIIDGSRCQGRIVAAKSKCDTIRIRLGQIDAGSLSSTGLSADLAAERSLLLALLQSEEQVLKPDSPLAARVQRSNNSISMFEAMLRAVVERRSDRLDEQSMENLKLDARWRKSEMERAKADGFCETAQGIITEQARIIVGLLGIIGKHKVVFAETGKLLEASLAEKDNLGGTIDRIASSMKTVSTSTEEALKTLIGNVISLDIPLGPYKDHSSSVNRRTSTIPPISAIKAHLVSPSKKPHRNSPKKGRTSIPKRRLSDQEKALLKDREKEKKEKKGVQWKDEAGKGCLAESESMIISVSPSVESTSDLLDVPSLPPRSASRAGSESEWEDEKTDDSFNFSFSLMSGRDSSSLAEKRPRSSRMDSGFLRSKGSATLASLAEDDRENETPKSARAIRRVSPLSDRCMNVNTPSENVSTGGIKPMSALHIPKVRDARPGSPTKRVPATPRSFGNKPGRRRSNIGPMRSERVRRRSSLIPQLPQDANMSITNGPKRVLMESSARRSPGKPKRLSLLPARLGATGKSRRPSTLGMFSFSGDASMVDLSVRANKPTWK
ncbi:kinesin-domain-containing protein [Thelephora ganbajun]|uniref:Kinesin-domain-containing protein n=1 Tax=Thelephora ganbajun TaxID=370292 RepID=A0ACB6ZMQ7_THEGA|nr:kinesin-domain-containing protein [Thelephora ganbajun]